MSRVVWDGSSCCGFVLSGFGFCGAVLEAEAIVSCLKDVAMVGKAVEQRGSHLSITEYAGPLAEAEIGGDDDAGALVQLGEQVKE